MDEMKWYKADLHIHTVLSPCGDLESSPSNIVLAAKEQGLDIIGLTDHNTLKHTSLTTELAVENDLFVLRGAEVTTEEEAHVLCFFESDEAIASFQAYLVEHLPPIENNPDLFGYQVVIDREENIVEQEDYLLISGITQSLEEIRDKVKELEGIFIPAHIDRPSYSVLSQLGIIPLDLGMDAVEISRNSTIEKIVAKHPYLADATFIRSSDAHFPQHIGQAYTEFYLAELSFEEIRLALHHKEGRTVRIPVSDKEPTY